MEGAIDKFELSDAAVEQTLHCRQKLVGRRVAHRDVERRQAKLALKRAAARRFYINDALRDVGVRVQFIRQRQAIKIGQGSGNDFHLRRVSHEGLPAHLGKRQIGLTDDDVIGQPDDFLTVAFVADLRPAKDNDQLRPPPLQIRHHLQRLGCVPDVHTNADDLRVIAENHLNDVDGSLIDVEFENPGLRLQLAQVRHQISQPERAMRVLRVQRGENDVRHAGGELSYTPSPRSNARIILPLLGNRREPTRYFFSGGKKWNFCPPMLASNIKPPLAMVNTTTPCVYFASAEALSAEATALTPALIAHSLPLKLSRAVLSSKKITSAKFWPPNCAPMVSCVMFAVPIEVPFSKTSPVPAAAPMPTAPLPMLGNTTYP